MEQVNEGTRRPLTNQSSQDIFLKLEGIQGESKDHTHREKIEVLSWRWKMSQDSSMHVGSGGGIGKATVYDLEVEHYVDRASPTLMICSLTGKHIKQATLVMRKAGGSPHEYSKIVMDDVLITGVQMSCNRTGTNIVETFGLSFAKVRQEYNIQRADGGSEGVVSAGFDIKGNAQL
ncbi:Hcp family type VI secretion system effector [Paraburkholderia caffeinilytica]|uniref:Hcp family type VI secretion system effector n=1 Tax=Paraburkholderia caffeinilytica TaxID=1761016 RepID=UPI003DA12DCE